MRIIFIGDIVGSLGRNILEQYLTKLKNKYRPNFIIVNGENAANGRGITHKIYKDFMRQGVDCITLGNHAFDNYEIFDFIEDAKWLVRPANYPNNTLGKGMVILERGSYKLAVINLQGRSFMTSIDCPFIAADKYIEEAKKVTNHIFIDFHAETTSEKIALAHYLNGRVSGIIGTHTHVPTADGRILNKGTAYQTDVGMTGFYDGVIGFKAEHPINKFMTAMPTRFEVADTGRQTLSACVLDFDDKTGLATKIETLQINEDHPFRD